VRWWSGFVVTLVLGLPAAALLIHVGGAVLDRFGDRELTEHTTATVVDVQDDGYPGEGTAAYIRFVTNDGESVVTRIPWPAELVRPDEGEGIVIGYDPDRPAHAGLSAAPVGDPRWTGTTPGDGRSLRGRTVTAAVLAGLTLLTALTTILWATRAPKPVRPRSTGPWPPPGMRPPYPMPPPRPPVVAPPRPPLVTPPVPTGAPPRFGRKARWLIGGAVAALLLLAATALFAAGAVLFIRDGMPLPGEAPPGPTFTLAQALFMAGGVLYQLAVGALAITAILASKVPGGRRAGPAFR
jgi:hypothetical protein